MTAPNPDELTDAAKSAIAEAVRIVREDKFEAYARESFARHATKVPEGTPPAGPPAEPPSSTPATPPATPPPGPTPPPAAPAQPATGVPEGSPPAKGRRSLWWGDLDDGV